MKQISLRVSIKISMRKLGFISSWFNFENGNSKEDRDLPFGRSMYRKFGFIVSHSIKSMYTQLSSLAPK
jgi:hypothetical protein